MISASFAHHDYGAQIVQPLHARRREFRRVWPWLEKAVVRGGRTHTQDGIWKRITANECQLWTEPKAAVVTTIEAYHDTGLREVRCWLAGGKMADARRLERRISEWATAIGAERILIAGRRGWLRALRGYDELSVTMTKDLA